MQTTNEFDYRKWLKLIGKHKRLFLITALSLMTIAVIVSYLLPEKYEAKSTVFIEKTLLNELVKGFAVTPSMEDKTKGLSYAMVSRPLLQKVIADLDPALVGNNDTETLIAKFQKNTNVELKNDENLFTISYKGENPRLAKAYVNTLVKRYIDENVSATRAESYGASKFLSDQVASVKEKMDKADAEVSRYRAEKGGVLSADPASVEREIAGAQQRIDEIEYRKAGLEATRSQLKKRNPARMQLQTLEKRLAEMRSEYTDSYPEVIRLKSELDSARAAAAASGDSGLGGDERQEIEKIDMEISALRGIESKQNGYIASSRATLRNIPSARSELDQLEREKANQKQMYDQLVARHGQSEFSKQMEVQDKATTFKIVDPAALPVKPISPNRVAIILGGILGGILAAFGLVLLMDYYDESVKSPDHLKSTGLPVLAVIPKMRIPDEIKLEKARDKKLYALSACYFSLILLVLLLEVFQMPLLSSAFNSAQFKQYLSQDVKK